MSQPLGGVRARRIRVGWWVIYGLLMLLELLLIPLHLPTDTEALLSYAIMYLLPMYLTVAATGFLFLRLSGVERRFWGFVGLSVALLVATDTYWIWYETFVDFRGPQIPNWAELGHLSAASILYVMIVSMTKFGEAPPISRVRFYLDVIGGGIVAFAVVYWWWTLPLFANVPMGHWPVATVAAVYPVGGILIFLTTLLIVLGWKLYRWRPWERLIAITFAAYGLSLITFPIMYSAWLMSPVQPRFDWYTSIWGFGHYMMLTAAVYRATSDDESVRAKPWSVPESGALWFPTAYPSFLALAMFAIGFLALRVADAPGGFVLVIAVALLALVLIVRSWLTSLELAYLKERSITDPVTHAFNQRHLYDRLPRDIAEAATTQTCVSVVAFDVADFRNIVGMSGESEGDRVLSDLTAIMRSESPDNSAVYRVGRDEFVVVMPRCSGTESTALAHRVCALAAGTISVDGVPIALSAGVASYPASAKDAATLVSRALQSQQIARSAERTDVVVYDAEVVEAADPLVRLERARRRSHRSRLRALAAAVDARDTHTTFHSETVAEIVSAFALFLELPADQTRIIETAAQVHDIGQIGLPDSILLKSGRLSAAEEALVEEHPSLGERLLAPAGVPEILPAVRHHHERWDGTGYPDALVGPDIPFEARVLAICDAFEAMTSTLSYRPALTTPQALAELSRCAGKQFDPQLVDAFTRMVVRMHGAISERMPDGRRTVHLTNA
jgi:diguanylate cyclase (GGDEF)-like protein